jgi:poly(3-hydroxybutyrate) depolymerase
VQIGFSTGGFLSNGIACRYPDIITAVGTDAGSLSWTYMHECSQLDGPVPFQSFHSLTDPIVPYNGTDVWAGQLDIDAMWRSKNGCDGTEEPYVTYSSATSSCQRWDCALVGSGCVLCAICAGG